jgi:hypothetical protein
LTITMETSGGVSGSGNGVGPDRSPDRPMLRVPPGDAALHAADVARRGSRFVRP